MRGTERRIVEERLRCRAARLCNGEKMGGLCRGLGISHKRGCKIENRFTDSGIDGEPTAAGVPVAVPSPADAEGRAGAVILERQFPNWGISKGWEQVRRGVSLISTVPPSITCMLFWIEKGLVKRSGRTDTR